MRVNRFSFTFSANGNSPVFGLHEDVGVVASWGTGVSAGVVKLQTGPDADFFASGATPIDEITLTYASGSPMAQGDASGLRGNVARINVSGLAGGSVTVTVTEYTTGTC